MIRFAAKGNKAAEILLYGDVGEGWWGGISAQQFASELKALGPVDTLDLRINSLGGDVFDGLAIYRLLVDHSATITTHIDGTAASIASVIAMAGKDILIGESSSMMIHAAWGIAVGNAKALRATADRMDNESSSIASIYAARSGRPLATILDLMDAETWFYGQEAVDAGLATSVAENMRLAARAGGGAWASQIIGRITERMRSAVAAPGQHLHPANNDARAQVESMRARIGALSRPKPPVR